MRKTPYSVNPRPTQEATAPQLLSASRDRPGQDQRPSCLFAASRFLETDHQLTVHPFFPFYTVSVVVVDYIIDPTTYESIEED